MGTDKALLVVGGQALAASVADAIGGAGARRVWAQGGDAVALGALGLDCVADRWPGRGPGVAVADALSVATADVIVVAACDHPGLDAATVSALVDAVGASDATLAAAASVAMAEQRLHPTLSAWRTGVCAPIAERWMADGGTSLLSLLEAVGVAHVVAEVDVGPWAARDVDSRADLSRYDSDAPSSWGIRHPKEPIVDIPQIDVAELAGHVAGSSRLFDVRQPDEYAEAHVPGAVLIPLAEVPDRLDDFAGDDTVYVICRSGARSARAVEFLRANGVDAVNVLGGTMAWIESGAETATGASPGE